MRILPIKQNYIIAKSNSANEKKSIVTNSVAITEPQEKKQNYLNYVIPIGVAIAAGIGIKYYRSRNITSAVGADIKNEASAYVKNLAESLGKWLNKDIDAKSLNSVISGEELLAELKKLEKQNFVASKENIEKLKSIYDVDVVIVQDIKFSPDKIEVLISKK